METDKILKRIKSVATILLMIGLLICSGCMTYIGKDGPYNGKIVDKETRQPLEGVVVVSNWGIDQWGSTSYYDTYETVTDKKGNFAIPGQGIQVFSDLTVPNLFIFKVGHEFVLDKWNGKGLPLVWEGERMVIGLRKLTMEERRRNSVDMPSGPKKKYKLLIRESNKEMMELGYSKDYILPEE